MIGKNFIKVLLLFFAIVVTTSTLIFAQEGSVDINNIQNINVDDLTDEQIEKFIKEVDSRGLTISQVELYARSRGVSSLQINKLKARINSVRLNTNSGNSDTGIDRLRENPVETTGQSSGYEGVFSAFEEDQALINPEEAVFGVDLFQSENLTFQPSANIPTPKNYQLGAGDDINIDIWGSSETTYQLQISPEGSIRIPNLGPIYISGLTVTQASSKIRFRLKKIYSDLGNNTYADISLGKIKSINVNIVGEVKRQGTYTLSSFASVFNALYMAGGPNENGSLRRIDHYRNGKKIASIDVYDFLFNGIQNNLSLNDQDMIIVRPYNNRVQIIGEVKRPGYYELAERESLEQLLVYAGEFTSEAYTDNITIKRNKSLKRVIESVDKADFGSFTLNPGDEISVGSILNRFENRVQISGAVNIPGEYEYQKGMTLSTLIKMAEGLREDVFYNRGVLYRQNSDLTLKSVSFDLNKIFAGEDIELQNEDFVTIKSIFELRDDYVVSIQGEVRSPGDYAYVDSLTVESLILSAGGFTETAAKSIVEVARRKAFDDKSDPTNSAKIFNFSISENLELSPEASSFVLNPYDLVVIRKSPHYEVQETVEIQGEANFPGKYVIEKKNERISDLLNRAGGITSYAYVKGATLVRRTEYYSDEANEAARLKRENIKELAERDTLLNDVAVKLKTEESIGINLEEIIKAPGSKYDLILKEGDVVGIPKQLETVRLRGELLYPSTVRFDKALSFKSYISQSGGFSDNAKRGKSYVLYANGAVKRTKRFFWLNFYPNVEPGAEIIVPEKPERRKITPGEVVGLTTGVATFGLIILRIVDFIESSQSSDSQMNVINNLR